MVVSPSVMLPEIVVLVIHSHCYKIFHWMTIPQPFSHSAVDGHLGSFWFGTITGDPTHLPLDEDVFAFDGCTPSGEMVGSQEGPCSVLVLIDL